MGWGWTGGDAGLTELWELGLTPAPSLTWQSAPGKIEAPPTLRWEWGGGVKYGILVVFKLMFDLKLTFIHVSPESRFKVRDH